MVVKKDNWILYKEIINMCNKLFLSHSSEDSRVVTAFVNFMYKIGLTEENIVCTSVPETKISVGNDIYAYLNNLISEEKIYVIYFLSDNYYASPVCLNEMGAVWLKKSDSLNLLLPSFNFEDIRGVVEKNKVGIKLGTCDNMTKAAFNEFLGILKEKFGINPTPTHWEIARDEFLQSALEDIRKFNMSFARSYCIGDLENDGCKIIFIILRFYNNNARIGASELTTNGLKYVYIPKTPIADITTDTAWLYTAIAKYLIIEKYSAYDVISEIPVEGNESRKTVSIIKELLKKIEKAKDDEKNFTANVIAIAEYLGYDTRSDHIKKLFKTISKASFHVAFEADKYKHIAITIHSSKGLEFEQIIVFAVENGRK